MTTKKPEIKKENSLFYFLVKIFKNKIYILKLLIHRKKYTTEEWKRYEGI
jgi:hypothetical protein